MSRFHFLITALHKNADLLEQGEEELNIKNKFAKVLNDNEYKFVISDEKTIDDRLNEYESLKVENERVQQQRDELLIVLSELVKDYDKHRLGFIDFENYKLSKELAEYTIDKIRKYKGI